MIATLGDTVNHKDITIDNVTATSGHYLARMELFEIFGKKSPFSIEEHESAGRFIPITQIRNPLEQSRFISDMIPLLHLNPQQTDLIKYTSVNLSGTCLSMHRLRMELLSQPNIMLNLI